MVLYVKRSIRELCERRLYVSLHGVGGMRYDGEPGKTHKISSLNGRNFGS